MSLLIENLIKTYCQPDGQTIPVLNIERFAVDEAEQVVLLGASGCGKTTLLNIVAGLRTADSGLVAVDGVDITRLNEPSRDRFRAERIGIVFQTFNLLPGFSALENVLLGMSFGGRNVDRPLAARLLEQVGLSHRLHHKPAQLSVGERQRVSVARALANRPRLMLADEPTANVDAENQQNVLDLIRSSCESARIALLLVTHSPQVADQFERVEQLTEFNRAVTGRLAIS